MKNQSFIRFGGIAGILLALTSWTSVAVYYTLVPPAQRMPIASVDSFLASLAQDSTGTQLFNGLYALIGAWALIGIMALYFRLREVDGAWMAFATLIGLMASFLTVLNGLQQAAFFRYLGAIYPSAHDFAIAAYSAPAPLNPLNAVTQGLTAPWFLIVALVMLRSDLPRLLAYLGLVAFADLTVGFIASLFGIPLLPIITAIIAGAVGGPVFWLWLGAILWRENVRPVRTASRSPAAAKS